MCVVLNPHLPTYLTTSCTHLQTRRIASSKQITTSQIVVKHGMNNTSNTVRRTHQLIRISLNTTGCPSPMEHVQGRQGQPIHPKRKSIIHTNDQISCDDLAPFIIRDRNKGARSNSTDIHSQACHAISLVVQSAHNSSGPFATQHSLPTSRSAIHVCCV